MKKSKIILAVVLLLIAAGCAAYAVYYFTNKALNEKVYEDLAQTVVATEVPATPSTEPTASAEPTYVPAGLYECPIDFDSLWAINEDVYAWIEIPGMNISYPILQHETENTYYLDHTIDNYAGYPGSIFTYSYNDKTFSSFNSVIYGHNMNDESMFGRLKYYRYQNEFDANRTINIYLPDCQHVYTIFAAVVYSDILIPAAYDFTWRADCQAFLDSIYNNGDPADIIADDITVTPDDHIITLSVCVAGQDTKRYLVLAVETDVID